MQEIAPEIPPKVQEVKLELPASKLTSQEAETQFPGPSEFCHLHNHSLFSVLDGVASPDAYFKECSNRKWPAFAITEHGVLSSIPDAYLASKATKVKQIVGVEFYFCDQENIRKKFEVNTTLQKLYKKVGDIKKSFPEFGKRAYKSARHLTILAKNEKGYENLLKLNRDAWAKYSYYKAKINLEILEQYHEGLIFLSGCMNGPISYELRVDNIDGFVARDIAIDNDIDPDDKKFRGRINIPIMGARGYMQELKRIFQDDFYVELQMPGVGETIDDKGNKSMGDIELFFKLSQMADEFKVKTVITNDCHYINRKDQELQKFMMAIDQQKTVDDKDLFFTNSNEQYLKTRAELRATFMFNGFEGVSSISEFERACDNTLEIASKCTQFKPDLSPKLPKIPNAEEELKKLAYDGLRKRGLDKNQEKYMMDEKMVTYSEQLGHSDIVSSGYYVDSMGIDDLVRINEKLVQRREKAPVKILPNSLPENMTNIDK